jgi:nitrite reductase/ring-hydroxylating ferredoxin subunit
MTRRARARLGRNVSSKGPFGRDVAVDRVRIGSLHELKETSRLVGKVGAIPICVFWSEGEPFALVDRCPHMGFPLHRGTIENGLLTCHWHHARFDLASGGTLDPFADDASAHEVEIHGDDVFVQLTSTVEAGVHHSIRLLEGLEQGLTLVVAKAVLGMFDTLGSGSGALAAVRTGVDYGIANRDAGWGTGLTVLTAVSNVLPVLDESDRPLALTQALAFVARDTRGQSPRFALGALDSPVSLARLSSWYRRFADTRNGDAAERSLATALASGAQRADAVALMGAAATDHLFMDGGHTIDFTNKAFELVDTLGWEHAERVLPTLAQHTAAASRAEESGEWRHPDDLVALIARSTESAAAAIQGTDALSEGEVETLAWAILADNPEEVVDALLVAEHRGASLEQLARAVAYAAALRLTRFHVQNDHGDWDVVHHAFTSANAVHQLVCRAPTLELRRGVYQGALRVFLDRFLNIPPARPPAAHALASDGHDLSELQACWDREGSVDEAGALVYGWLRSGGSRASALAALGSALFAEDAEFHWFQTYEAAVRQSAAWPADSEPAALILVGAARFLAAQTPTRRERAQVVRIATRLRRGDPLYEEE